MTTKKLDFPSATDAVFTGWKARHIQAMQNPRTLFEQAFTQMLAGWECYAQAHQTAYDSHILSDGVLGASWSVLGEGLLGLLNGELGRLDGGALDQTIRSQLEPQEGEETAPTTNAMPQAKEDTTDFEDALSLRKGGAV